MKYLLLVAALTACCLCAIAQKEQRLPGPGFGMDGQLGIREWYKKEGVKTVAFNEGVIRYAFARDTLFMALDIYADTHNDGNDDMLKLYLDRNNNNNIIDGNDLVLTSDKSPDQQLRSYPLRIPDPGNTLRRVAGKIAAGFSTTPAVNYYEHRTWELAVPLKVLNIVHDGGLSINIVSRIPFISRSFENSRYSYMISPGSNNITPLTTSAGLTEERADGKNGKFESKTSVLADGSIEITFSDSSKVIRNTGGITYISPEGLKSRAAFVTAPLFRPPALPSDVSMRLYLDTLRSTLTGTVSDLLRNDATSISNFLKGEENMNVYDVIYRRFQFLEFYINRSK